MTFSKVVKVFMPQKFKSLTQPSEQINVTALELVLLEQYNFAKENEEMLK